MDTIVALATPNGRSGIGVIRVSGDESIRVLGGLVRDENLRPEARKTVLKKIYDHEGEIDEALVVCFFGPNSYTGEDVVEISCHGSPVLLKRVLEICLDHGARLAEPGEFTMRALANGRMDLSQAEAVRDLINANSLAMTRQAVRQLRGEFSHRLTPVKDELLDVIVVLESALEFVEDDLPEVEVRGLLDRLSGLESRLLKLADTYSSGRILREGIRIALVGRPNVGKSSLFNALVGEESAIVTDVPGTTRDQIKENFLIGGIPVALIDTAGLRETEDQVERIGVERSKRAMADADLVLVVLDGSQDVGIEDAGIIDDVEGLRSIVVVNKDDLFDKPPNLGALVTEEAVIVSAKTGHGIDELRSSILSMFATDDGGENALDGFLVSDARHYDLLKRSAEGVSEARALLAEGKSEEIVLIGLHNAIRYLGEITGETTTEDMLTRVFSTFCIGK
ncbi:MAG: tRNA uridine-5-carboxymethylaminomethyl(34) synthesis GTPase MnmE [Pyrinomonadaceae bacterium]